MAPRQRPDRQRPLRQRLARGFADARDWFALALGGLLILPASLAAQEPPIVLSQAGPAPADLALMGTIPIYWGERLGLAELLFDQGVDGEGADHHQGADRGGADRGGADQGGADQGGAHQGSGHWARPVIERQWRLRPLDFLSAQVLGGYSRLLLAQPRGLAAEENLALDSWLRGGGLLLLFADPMMTGDSRFPIGDRRRPQDVTLLSPILNHWGLELRFDENQPPGRRIGDGVPPGIPVDLPGVLTLREGANDCVVLGEGIAAECRLGAGRVLVVADAALLNADSPGRAAEAALISLLTQIFASPAG